MPIVASSAKLGQSGDVRRVAALSDSQWSGVIGVWLCDGALTRRQLPSGHVGAADRRRKQAGGKDTNTADVSVSALCAP